MKPDLPQGSVLAEDRVSPIWHAAPWLIAIAYYFLASGYLSLGTNILVYILLTLSLDLALGYAGIITLGHAAFFGFGAYAAGLFAVHVYAEPVAGLIVATIVTGIFAMLTGMLILHTQGVTLLMLTLAISILLAEWANRAHSITGGDDGLQVTMKPVLGLFRFDLWGNTAYLYSLVVLFLRACGRSVRPCGGGSSSSTRSQERWRAPRAR
jgi:branched-chain amino acid transport system permease protein